MPSTAADRSGVRCRLRICRVAGTTFPETVQWSNSLTLLEFVQERARLLQEEITRRTGEATNHNLYIVSLLTAIFLPITLITGIFGMNVGGLPWVEKDGGFLWVLGIMLVTAATSLVLLHWRRFF